MYQLRMLCPASNMDITHTTPVWTELSEAQEAADYQSAAMRQRGYSTRPMIVNERGEIIYDPRAEERQGE